MMPANVAKAQQTRTAPSEHNMCLRAHGMGVGVIG
jgi:hypothetical protein